MIPEAEIRRVAARLGVDPMIVDLDYVLGCFLATLYRQPEAAAMRFKGGTCLRKCYYPDYRFSEDLDFTVERRMGQADLQKLLDRLLGAAADDWEIDFLVRPVRVEVVDDEYGKESYQVRVYYRGPLRRGGDPRAIRLDLTASEVLVFPAAHRPIIHPYSDASLLADVRILCYDLLEMVAEKIRALAGQRQYAICRDIYDIDQLTTREAIDLTRLVEALPAKWEIKGLEGVGLDPERLDQRREDFRTDWERNLIHLLPDDGAAGFDVAWKRTTAFLAKLSRLWKRSHDP